ncbi:DUF4173 domain-containing protein [Pedobacter aquatilis]|uniref:DUF4153 domain-containing protein n=1 Tax=Pedobacter aquatilis TaxID=351343 RepID=UPI00292F86C5|nr:DUF4173 domain-containing protein [Pedobacter aquatilis]
MKTKSNYLLLSTLIGGLLFNYLFWMEDLGLNLLLYSIFVIAITVFNDEVIKSTKFKIYAAAHLFAAILVVIINSDLSIIAYFFSFIFFVGYSHYQSIRSIYAAFLAAIMQFITIPFSLLKRLSEVKIGNYNFKPIIRPIKYIVLPIFIVFVFTMIYSGANKVFGHYLEVTFVNIGDFLYNTFGFIFKDLSFDRFMHLCFGILVTGGLLITFYSNVIGKIESYFNENLSRKRRDKRSTSIWNEVINTFFGQLINKKLALKTEYIIGFISFAALNLLLLCLNGIDIWWLWLGKGRNLAEVNYSADLHDGTNALIFSIVLAMAVILYFFRGNLNFYYKNKTLKALAFAWMIQNFILIISVFIRDGYYIEFYGLTHKRIGVLVFALLCIIGLATVYLKVNRQKTFFYLFKVNGNIWFALLLVFSSINWDVFIARYNLTQSSKTSIDADFLLSLSNKTLPVLDKYRAKLHYTPSEAPYQTEIAKPQTADFYQKRLDERIDSFRERYESLNWLSLSFQDWNTAGYFGLNKTINK